VSEIERLVFFNQYARGCGIMNSSFDDWMDANYQRVVREEKGSCFHRTYYITYVPKSDKVTPFVSVEPKLSVRRVMVAAVSMSLLIVCGFLVLA
jgi:hypothetical protein